MASPVEERSAAVIMAKVPHPGEVKTRLCPPLSAAEAAELYRCFLLDRVAQVRTLQQVSPTIAYAPVDGRRFFERSAPDFVLIPQRGADLGERLLSSFDQVLRAGYPAAVAIGTDSPTLPTRFLQQALVLIQRPEIDVVLGPSEDGGYYLIGLRTLHQELFEGMAWSTAQVFPETIRRAEAKGLKVACLPPWFDVDTPDDLERLKVSLMRTEGREPLHTRRFFRGNAE